MRSPSNSSKRSERSDDQWRHQIKNHLTAVKGLSQLLGLQLSQPKLSKKTLLTITEKLRTRLDQLIDEFSKGSE